MIKIYILKFFFFFFFFSFIYCALYLHGYTSDDILIILLSYFKPKLYSEVLIDTTLNFHFSAVKNNIYM